MVKKYDRIIVGAGASGLYAAATCENRINGLIIDHSHYPGLKLLLSGNGQCNITHGGSIKDFLSCYGDKGRKLRTVLYSANNLTLMQYIESIGVPLLERPDGKVFPRSMKASDVLKALLKEAEKNGYALSMDEGVKDIYREGDMYVITTDKDIYRAPVLIIAAGGKSYPKTGSDGSIYAALEKLGIEFVSQSPALTPIYVHGYRYKEASGVSFRNAHVVFSDNGKVIAENTDDLLLTHRCFSGPAVINISRYARPGMKMTVSFISTYTANECSEKLKSTYQKEKKKISTYISRLFKLPLSFTELLLKELEIDGELKASTLQGDDIEKLTEALTCHSYDISGLGGFNEAMVTRGGISLDEVDMKTMESKKYPGLYFIGEILDVDGDTGGYNLQFAYSSAKAVNRAL